MYDFIFKPFNEMTEDDYKKIGFKSGLEIHQQLLTEKKLFCRCPAGKYTREFDAEILRHMRPTLSEMGVYDGTALMEFKTKKNIIYHIKRETVCTYEMDDTPPFLINEDALEIAIGIGILYNCNIVDELHIARKQYLDGSIPTGFQRTAIYALDGWIPYKDRKVKIVQMSIEEDSCREVSDIGHERVYLTDRLGMPLIETVTEPAMRTPQEVVEIKGVPQITLIPLLTYNEAMRQWNLLRLREELKKRGITPETFKAESYDITKLLKKVHYAPLKSAADSGMKISCVVLKGFKDLLHWHTQTDTYFSKEISDRVRVIACLTNIPNLIHSDSKSDTISSADWLKIKKFTNAADTDTMVIVWGSDDDVKTAVNEIIIRAKEATIGIPSETRQAMSDGTNGFERILPGADRMYPDTDLPPKKITKEKLDKIKSWLPQQFWKRIEWYIKLGIPKDTIEELSISPYADLFKKAVNDWKINPTTVSVFLIQYPKRLKKKGSMIEWMHEGMFEGILKSFAVGKIPQDALLTTLKTVAELGAFTEEVIQNPASEKEVDEIINSAKSDCDKMTIYNQNSKSILLMGMIMKKLRGRIPAKDVADRIGFVN
ncbi:MAG: Glu-tRNA(Gln) amidotransferase GatDE subunit E [Ignavibacteriales bacterium]|nr:Glu-tRNA(Gln) amidotransferase GatDE subunit E [Ignavibacteriales bacterium]